MRLWTLHPRYLDAQGLVALWREALLAQSVLGGRTRGYRVHPQLERFRGAEDPRVAIASYLRAVHVEALSRGYRFDQSLIATAETHALIRATDGQIRFEASHLRAKLARRSPALQYRIDFDPDPHPLFHVVAGPVELWERDVLALAPR